MPSKREELEVVLDHVFHARPRAVQLTCTRNSLAEYANHIGITHRASWWSHTLQEYRGMRTHRYRIVSEGYGRAAVWRIIAIDRHASKGRMGQSQDHHLYAIEDAIKREGKDLDYEVLPSLSINGAPPAELAYRINEWEVLAVQRLVAAGKDREEAIVWMAEPARKLRDRWAA